MGLVLVLIVHLPRFAWLLLELSYAVVFNNRPNLTADTAEHLKRARKLLRKRKNSLLLYAALELRFALERMTHAEVAWTSKISRRVVDDPDPIKRLKAQRRADPAAAHPHRIYLINRQTGERIDWGEHKPLDMDRIRTIQGRLGDLLHPKQGLMLGIHDDPWYVDTRAFLSETHQYLATVYKGNKPFFMYRDAEGFEMEQA